MHIDIAFNPAAGRYCARQLDRLVAAFKEHRFEPRLHPTRPDGIELPDDARLVCIHGGDGTLRLVVRSLGERVAATALCISPVGTINLIARELGFARNPERLAAQVAAAWHRGPESWVRSPLVTFGGEPVMACLSTGADSAAVARISGAAKARIGRLAYVTAAAGMLRDWPRRPVSVRAKLPDGSAVEASGEALFLARGRYYAGPFTLSRRARVETDTFELVVMERASRVRSAGLAMAVMAGLPTDRLGLTRTWTVREAELGQCAMPVQADGDIVAPQLAEAASRACVTSQAVRYCI